MTSATAALRGPPRKKNSHHWDRHPQDFYVEPRWCSERLFAVERFDGPIYDPACGLGRIVLAALNAGYATCSSDLVARSQFCPEPLDFLATCDSMTNIVSNPPFGIAEKFVAHALRLAERKVAMLLPAAWVQGDERSRWLETTPLRRVYFITPRPSMPPGPAILAGQKPGNGTSDFAWFVWRQGYMDAPEIKWLRRVEDGQKRLEFIQAPLLEGAA
jgi:hypothetical protein